MRLPVLTPEEADALGIPRSTTVIESMAKRNHGPGSRGRQKGQTKEPDEIALKK